MRWVERGCITKSAATTGLKNFGIELHAWGKNKREGVKKERRVEKGGGVGQGYGLGQG